MFKRELYLKRIRNLIDKEDVKVISGVRRSGKSKLLEAFKQYVTNNVANANIIHINFNLTKYEDLKEYHALNDYIEGLYEEDKENFVFIDEVQMCPNFEVTINIFFFFFISTYS